MSKGPGRVMRCITATFADAPAERFTTAELAARVYPGEPIEERHTVAVQRALRHLAPVLNLKKCRVGERQARGWHHVWGL